MPSFYRFRKSNSPYRSTNAPTLGTTEEVDQLWEDVTTQIGAEHFMGSIVLNDEVKLQPQIIDGQQRLTTLLMLLALIRDEYRALNSPLAGRPHSLLTADPYTGDEKRFKLRLGEANRSLFRDFFLRQPGDEGRKEWSERTLLPKEELVQNADLIGNASRLRALLDHRLGSSTGEARLRQLTDLEEKLSKRLLFVVIRVGNVDDAFLLFETLNDRGLQLSAADLVKSHLLSRIEAEKGREKVGEAAQEWADVVDLLRGADIGRFLRYFLLMYDPKVQMDKVFKLFKNRLERDSAESLLAHIKTMARYFGEFVMPALVSERAIRDVIEDINDLRAPTTYVVLLPARFALQATPDEFVGLARLTEALVYRWTTIVGRNAQQLESIFQEAGSLLAKVGASALPEAQRKLNDAMPSRAEFTDAFRTKRMGTQYVARYTLRKIEEVLSPNGEWALKSPARVNIEHIMPQHLSEPWRAALGADAVEQHAESVDRWGNLTLLSEKLNKAAQDSSFQAKIEIYSGTPGSKIQMTQLLRRETSWGPKEIDNRQRWLAEIAEALWSVDGLADASNIKIPDYPYVDVEDAINQVRLLIAEHENQSVELKSTARINLFTNKKDPEIEKGVGKSICAFANSYDGGTLLIGVADDGKVLGIEPDYAAVNGRDGFGLWLAEYVRTRLDPLLATLFKVTFVEFDRRTVCRVDIPPMPAPVFLSDGEMQRFYVRVQNGTREYSGHDLLNYQAKRWPQP